MIDCNEQTIKRQEAKKKKSQEEWKQRKRMEKVETDSYDNEQKQQQQSKNRPGFEGKKKGFLNGKKKGTPKEQQIVIQWFIDIVCCEMIDLQFSSFFVLSFSFVIVLNK